MNIENVTTVNELAEFMDEEAVRTGREDSEQKFVNGKGIYQQWHKRINFPYAIFYIVAEGEVHNMKSMWFDIDGNKTARPKRNTVTDTLYRND